MAPALNGFDHIHVYVESWQEAETWYREILGFERVEALMPWAVEGGPLTVQDAEGKVHLALFERQDHEGSSAIAFAVDGKGFLAWKDHLESRGIELRITDHELAYSLYFYDPDRNMHEITTYEHDLVRQRLA